MCPVAIPNLKVCYDVKLNAIIQISLNMVLAYGKHLTRFNPGSCI